MSRINVIKFSLTKDPDVKVAVHRARLLATLAGLSDRRRQAFSRAVREVAKNGVQHATGVSVSFAICSEPRPLLVAAVSDQEPLTQHLEQLIKSPITRDCGLKLAQTVADELSVAANDEGKVISILMDAPDVDGIDEATVAEWVLILKSRNSQDALVATEKRSRELASQLAAIQRQRSELEAELLEAKSMNETLTLLSLVASKTDNAVVIMDHVGHTTWVNDAFIRMTGFALADVNGERPDAILAGGETDADALSEIDSAFAFGRGVVEEFLQYRRDGSTSWISLSLTPIHDDTGEVSRWIGIGTDITRRREAQQALEDARSSAENASRLKGEFLANMSHEIRTPMNAILGMTDLALGTQLDLEQLEYLQTVKQSAESLLELLNDILDLSRIESGRMDIDAVPFHLPTLLDDVIKPLRFVAKTKRLEVTAATEVSNEWIIGDPLRVRQVLVNLIGNAIKFTTDGSVDVRVEETPGDSHGLSRFEFSVRDTGVGIPDSKLHHIFDAFTQADTSTTRQFGGTGLGLAISSELLQLMGGSIDVESQSGKGSCFRFTLPAGIADPQEFEQVNAAETQIDPSTVTNESLRILVADDYEANRDLLSKILERHGHSVITANDGHEALTEFDREQPDVILMDIQMPELDGFQTTAAIRARELETQTHVPIIAVTAHSMRGDREACLAAGMDAYLSKPVKAAEVLTLIDSLSDNQVNVSPAATTSTGYVFAEEQTAAVPQDQQPQTDRFAEALDRLDGDRELLLDQMQFFLDGAPPLLDQLSAAITSKSADPAKLAAHRLKSLFATFDDHTAAELCSKLEHAAARDEFDGSDVPALKRRTAELIANIGAFRDRE
jgi:PAS domain S-box-containing protein